ncbi:competence type IV pilus minor pilin ComGD [Lentibacillus sp. N15]|uniref:competence type IV pilus minor pilin ComGD n=1 Tax=Lentibacillus songyuanensis TaxID=3136161 RepID=UPI0031BACA90
MKKNGFTLLEIVFVLGIWSILLLLVVPIQFSLLDHQEENQFFQTFQSDILFLQSMAYANTKQVDLTFDQANHRYTIQFVDGDILRERTYPADWQIEERTIEKNIAFNDRGTVKQPGVISVVTSSARYNITFPLGKGRYYIEKQ